MAVLRFRSPHEAFWGRPLLPLLSTSHLNSCTLIVVFNVTSWYLPSVLPRLVPPFFAPSNPLPSAFPFGSTAFCQLRWEAGKRLPLTVACGLWSFTSVIFLDLPLFSPPPLQTQPALLLFQARASPASPEPRLDGFSDRCGHRSYPTPPSRRWTFLGDPPFFPVPFCP